MDFLTVGDIAKKLNAQEHRIRWVVLSRQIKPVARVAGARVFDAEGVEAIRQGLEETAAHRQPAAASA